MVHIPASNLREWQDVFEIDGLEVYGLGGPDVAETQRREREFERREAERRRGVQLRVLRGELESERELLMMAGILSDRSGGSMG